MAENRVCVGNQKDSNKKCVHGSSLVSSTFGNKVISALKPPSDVAELYFTKSNDDWLNEIDAKKAYSGVRNYALEGENLPSIEHPTLKNLLDFRGFEPEKTNLFVTGV